MARHTFGGTSADFVTRNSTGGSITIVGGAVINFYSAAASGTHYTDLLNNAGSAATTITAETDGSVKEFQGPSGITVMWADAGGARRVKMVATDEAATYNQPPGTPTIGGPFVLPFFNIKNYGASTGSADNATAIQAAINDADTAGGGVVQIPQGNYVSGPLTCKPNVSFRGVGFDLAYTGRNSRITLKAGSNASLFTVPWGTVNNNWEFLHLEGAMASQSGTSWGIYYAYNPANSAPQTYQQAKIQNTSIKGFLSGGAYVGKWNEGVDFINCFIANNGGHGVQIETSDCMVQGGHIMSNPGDGVRLGNSSCTVIGVSSLAGNGRGLAIVSGGADTVEFSQLTAIANNQVADCHIDTNLTEGIFIQGNNNTITGGVIASNSQTTNGASANVKVDGKLSDGTTTSSGNKCVGITFGNTGQANKPSYHVLQSNFGASSNFVDLTGCTFDLTGVVNDNVNDWRVYGGTLGITKTGHLLSQSYTANSPATNPYTAAVAVGTAAGTSPPAATITGTDLRGQVFTGTGTATTTGALVTVTFAKPYLSAPFVVLTPGNAATAAVMVSGQVYASTSTTTFSVNVGAALAISQSAGTYQWFYTVIG